MSDNVKCECITYEVGIRCTHIKCEVSTQKSVILVSSVRICCICSGGRSAAGREAEQDLLIEEDLLTGLGGEWHSQF